MAVIWIILARTRFPAQLIQTTKERGCWTFASSLTSRTPSEVERLGEDSDWDLFIFPMNAIGRGVNIVYRFGERVDKAMIGSGRCWPRVRNGDRRLGR